MDPANPDSFNHRTEKLSTGWNYHFVDQKPDGYDPDKTVTILALHGFPEFWWTWRYQIKSWVSAGYRVIVPDMLGYRGRGTDEPEGYEEYTSKKLSNDLAALLDLVGVEKAVIVGHDWGSFIAGRFALWHPERLLALGLMGVAHIPPYNFAKLTLEQVVAFVEKGSPEMGIEPNFDLGYQLYLASQKIEDDLKDPVVRKRFLTLMFGYLNTNAPWSITRRGELEDLLVGSKAGLDLSGTRTFIEDDELEYYISQLPSLHGPLCYYRTTELRYDEESDPETGFFTGKEGRLKPTINPDLPVLFIRGLEDPASPEYAQTRMLLVTPQTKVVEVKSGHWLTIVARDEVSAEVLRWLKEDVKMLTL